VGNEVNFSIANLTFIYNKKNLYTFQGIQEYFTILYRQKHLYVSSPIQTLLSVLELHQINRCCGSWTIPPVRNFTLPRRI